jgi:hypothetical protein
MRQQVYIRQHFRRGNAQSETGALGQSLERRGQPSIGVTVYEKKAGGALHGHSRHFVHKDNMEVIERFADRFDRRGGDSEDESESVEIHARMSVASDAGYILKQHQFPGPEPAKRRFWQPTVSIIIDVYR